MVQSRISLLETAVSLISTVSETAPVVADAMSDSSPTVPLASIAATQKQ